MKSKKIVMGLYEYYIVAYAAVDFKYKGTILLTRNDSIRYSPIVEIYSSIFENTEYLACLRASILAFELISTDTIEKQILQKLAQKIS